MLVHSSTQHPSEIQHLVAAALGVPDAAVTVELRRLGGGFGGKETQAAVYAVGAALLARATGRPVKLRADRDDDIIGTGKRHDFLYQYDVGFDREGRIEALDLVLASRCGLSADLSAAVNDRAVFHCDNAYFLQNVRIVSHRCKTNTVSSTAFRGFGGPQGMFAVEAVIAGIARHLGLDALDVRKRNLYGAGAAQRHPLRHDAEGQRAAGAHRRAGRALRLPQAPRCGEGLQRGLGPFQARARAHAGQVRHRLHRACR